MNNQPRTASFSKNDHAKAESLLGFSWSLPEDFFKMEPSNQERALWRVKKLFPEIIFDTTALEGNPFTFPQVQTLLEGITVGGQKISDADQVLNQSASWKRLLQDCKTDSFSLDKKIACELQSLVARGEALQEGIFRTGGVTIAGSSLKLPAAEKLDEIFEQLQQAQACLHKPIERGIATFLSFAKNQFFWDGNKRTGRLLMNGILLSEGQDIITVPAKLREEFNTKMLRFYESNDATEMFVFMEGQRICRRFE